MKTYKAHGIAIRGTNLGEADKIVTFITSTGKLSAVVKGVRRTSSKFGGRLEPGNDLELVVTSGRNLDTVVQVQMSRVRPWLRSDLVKLQTAYAVLEMADKLTTEKCDDNTLLKLTSATLDRLEVEERPALLLLVFDIKALAISGFMPNLNGCVVCGARKGLDRFDPIEGGLLCREHGSGRGIPISASDKRLIKEIINIKLAELGLLAVDEPTISNVGKIIWKHIRYHVHGEYKTRNEAGQIDG